MNSDKSSSTMAFASVAFGIISIIASCFGTSLIFGSIGLILALLSRGGSNAYPKNAVAGLILNAIGIFIGVTGMQGDVSTGGMALRIAGTILFAQGVDNFVLQPVLYSNRAKAHPLEIFLVILIAGSLAGVLGMLLAIPASNVIRVFAKEFFNNFRVVQKLTEKI